MKLLRTILLAGVLLIAACTSSRQPTDSNEQTADERGEVIEPNESISSSERLMDMLRRTPGVYISERGEISIRGAAGPPLLVVDGVPLTGSSLDFLNPADIESIRVLKGEETTLYGSRGGNGVIEITTKRGN